jgi:hypothetical protein
MTFTLMLSKNTTTVKDTDMSEVRKPQASGEMSQVMIDLDIQFDDMFENHEEFAKRVTRKARELAAQLDRKTPLADVEADFKAKAYQNKDAKAEASELHGQILALLQDRSPEVLANLLQMMPSISDSISNEVKGMAIRNSNSQVLSKRHIHMMYTRLKKGYDTYVTFVKMMEGILLPAIPAKSGNFGDDSAITGTKIHRIYVMQTDENGKEFEMMYTNPWTCARHLGLEIKFYSDLIDMIVDNNYEIKGKAIRLEEVLR